jgi:hypothetical protein
MIDFQRLKINDEKDLFKYMQDNFQYGYVDIDNNIHSKN